MWLMAPTNHGYVTMHGVLLKTANVKVTDVLPIKLHTYIVVFN